MHWKKVVNRDMNRDQSLNLYRLQMPEADP